MSRRHQCSEETKGKKLPVLFELPELPEKSVKPVLVVGQRHHYMQQGPKKCTVISLRPLTVINDENETLQIKWNGMYFVRS